MRRVLVPLAISPVLPPAGSTVHALAGRSMGTSWSARVVLAPGQEAPLRGMQGQLDEVVAQMSHWEDGSDLTRYNRAAAGSWQQLPQAFFHVLGYALDVARSCGGAYDPCAGALVDRWGFGANGRHDQDNFTLPDAQAVAALQALPRHGALEIDPATRSIRQPGGLRLDLSSVAKGFGVDQLARCLDAHGVHHYLVEVGGELRGAGVKPEGDPWWVALEDVPGEEASTPTVVALHGLSLATSGDYRRYYHRDGKRSSHTLDPRSGFPIQNALASVSVLHKDCMAADALSTALTVLGPEDGLRYAEEHGLAARFLVRRQGGLQEVASSAFLAMLQ